MRKKKKKNEKEEEEEKEVEVEQKRKKTKKKEKQGRRNSLQKIVTDTPYCFCTFQIGVDDNSNRDRITHETVLIGSLSGQWRRIKTKEERSQTRKEKKENKRCGILPK